MIGWTIKSSAQNTFVYHSFDNLPALDYPILCAGLSERLFHPIVHHSFMNLSHYKAR